MFEFLLILSILLIAYNYFLYPALVILLAKNSTKNASVNNEDFLPSVSFVIAAYNEEKVIQQKLENTLGIDYPTDKFEIILVSDGSDDSTHEIGLSFEDQGIKAIHQPERQGKSAALNRAVEQASGDIIVFSDANNDFDTDAVRQLIKHFQDEEVGGVTGAKHIYHADDRESSVGDGLYWRYESAIKHAESQLGSITGAEGEILAVRKSLFVPIDKGVINDDQAITFHLVRQGYRILYEKNAKASEYASIDLKEDMSVKVRMTTGGFQTIVSQSDYLLQLYRWFPFSFFSHKILRYLTPHFMIIAFLTNLFVMSDGSYYYLFLAQLAFYALSLYGWFNRQQPNLGKIFYIPMYFCAMNYALFVGFVKYLDKTQGVNWSKARR